MFTKLFSYFMDTLIFAFFPLVHLYQSACSDLLFNVAAEDATGIEKWANELLIPYHFVFCGKIAVSQSEERYELVPRFSYETHFWEKTALSFAALPVSLTLGGTMKALSLLSTDTQKRQQKIKNSFSPKWVAIDEDLYNTLGEKIGQEREPFISQGHLRRKGDEKHLAIEKEALREVAEKLNEAGIIWWVDCGTCIGAYRYGGVIPWDTDLDIALLLPDFQNVVHALSQLNSEKYLVEDWSGRDFPLSYLKVCLKQTSRFIDLYFFQVDVEKREITHLFSLDKHTFFSELVKERERSFIVPTSFDVMFPLKKGKFDGVDVFLPHNPEKYLQMRYGENLAPAKIFNPKTNEYEKDLTHPYWQNAYAH